ncbi:MAG: ATP-grasp domain-containing protein [Chitinophagaceae bacterium]|nr:ATP-grasp domain-containing protein [Chitinophagaceae bacterium]
MLKKITHHPFIIRLTNWEYWSFNTVYALLYPIFILYCIRARSFFFFSAANPTIENGGFLMESKKKIADLIPANFQPTTLYFEPATNVNYIIQQLNEHQINYPFIVKPDVGGRGRGVSKVNNETELISVVQKFQLAFIIQPFIGYEHEIGLFYVRYPNQPKGKITGIVKKEFVQVIGNGKNTIEELLLQNKRYILQIDALRNLCANKLPIVLENGKKEVLLQFGNHARGSLFLDTSHWVDEQLEESFNKICNQINGFYYGRMDIKYESLELLKQGKNFSIIELNGSGSEPTHIYDPKHSLFFAWKEIIRHWDMMYKISMLNKKNGIAFMSFSDGKKMFKDNAAYEAKLALM